MEISSQLWFYLAWVLAAGLFGFATSAVFSEWLRFSRRLFLVPYFVLSGIFLYGFCCWSQIDLIMLLVQNWYWGLLTGAIIGAFLTRNVLSQPAAARQGADLIALVSHGRSGLSQVFYGSMAA